MKAAPFLLAGLLVTIAGCNRSNTAHSVFGPANLHVQEAICAGKAALIHGSASIHDARFSGDTNVVLCTNETHLNPVRCKATSGALMIESNGNDVINYGRIR